jgi:hypothetical protein
MAGPIRPSGAAPIAAIGSGASGSGTRTGKAMRRLASNIAERVAREFRLLDDSRQHPDDDRRFSEGEDIYELRDVARELAHDLQARPAEAGLLARSLDAFALHSVSLMAARPEAASLDTIARAIAANEQANRPETVDSAIGQIDQTTRDIGRDVSRDRAAS